MKISPGFAYAQARIQARFGERPERVARINLDQIENFGRYLQQAGATGFHRWIEKVGPDSDAHAVEISLRDSFRNHVGEVSRWVPKKWSDAVRWFGLLIDMEQLRRIVTDEPLPDWLRDDPFLRRLIDVPASWPLTLLAEDGSNGERLAAKWRETWFQYWPGTRATEARSLEELASMLPVAAYDDVPHEKLERRFRQQAPSPVAVFSYLVLVLADLLQLKGQMMRRIEFARERN